MLNQWVGEEDDVGNHEDADPLQATVKESMSWEWLVHFCGSETWRFVDWIMSGIAFYPGLLILYFIWIYDLFEWYLMVHVQ